MSCISLNDPFVVKVSSDTAIPKIVVAAKLSKYLESNEFPSEEEFKNYLKKDTVHSISFENDDELPFYKESVDKIKSGSKSITVRSIYHREGIIKTKEGNIKSLYDGYVDIDEYSKNTGLSKSEIRDKFIGNEEVAFKHIDEWLKGNNKMHVYTVTPVNGDYSISVDDKFENHVNKLNNILVSIDKRLKSANEADREILLEKRKEIKKSIRDYEKPKNKELSFFLDQMVKDLASAKVLLNGDNLSVVNAYLGLYDSFSENFSTSSEILNERIKSAIGELDALKNDYLKATNIRAAELVGYRNEDGKKVAFKSESGLSTTLFSARDSINPFVRGLYRLIDDSINKIAFAKAKFMKEHKVLVDELKKAFPNNTFDFMKQLDENGKPTGYYVDKYNSKYNKDSINSKFNENDADSLQRQFNFLKDNHDVVVDEVLEKKVKEDISRRNEDRDYDFSEISSNEERTSLKEKWNEKDMFAVDSKELKRLLSKDFDSLSNEEVRWLHNFFNKPYFVKNHIKFEVKPEATKYLDSRYLDIEKWREEGDIRARYYDFTMNLIRETAKKRRNWNDISYFATNYIPEYQESVSFNIGNIPKILKDGISEFSEGGKHIDPITGEVEHSIPFRGLSGNVRPEDKSYNMENVLNFYMDSYYNKLYKEDVHEDSKVILNSIKNQNEIVEVNGKSTGLAIESKDNTAYKQSKYLIDTLLYNQSQEQGKTLGNVLSSEEKNRLEELKKLVKNGLTDEELSELNDLQSRDKVYTEKKVVSSMLGLTVKSSLAFNMFAGFAEMLQSTISMLVESASGKYFTDKQYFNAFRKAISDIATDGKKVDLMFKNFQLLDDFGLELSTTDKFNKAAFWHYSQMEKVTKLTLIYAYLSNKEGVDGKSLLDSLSFNDNGNITVGGEDLVKHYDNGAIVIEDRMKQMLGELSSLSKQMFNRDAKKDPILLEKSTFGRLIGQFRAKWLFEQMSRRFGEENESAYIDKKGYFRSLLWDNENKLDLNRAMKILYAFHFNKNMLKELGAEGIDKENIARAMRELHLIVVLGTLYIAASASADGDDEDNKIAKFALNLSYRGFRDISFYTNPQTAKELFSNVIPALRTASNMMDFVGAMGHGLVGDFTANEGTKKEYNRLAKTAIKITPYGGGMYATYRKFFERFDNK